MDKKIIIALAAVLSIVYSCNSVSINSNKVVPLIAKYDTVNFGSEKSVKNYREFFFISGATKLDNGVAIKTNGKGVNVWIDSVLYFSKHENKFVAVASTLDYGFSLLYYNGDSLSIEVIAINRPKVEECKANNFNVISITDSSYNSGYLTKSFLFYRIARDGTLGEKKDYFPQKKATHDYNFNISIKCTKDSVILYNGRTIEYIYK